MKNCTCFAYRLHSLFAAAAFSHGELAKLLGITEQTVRQWEAGTKVPDICQLRVIAKLTDLPYEWFLDPPAPLSAEIAQRLGLNRDTVELMMNAAKREPKQFLHTMDDAVYTIVEAMQTAQEG